MILSVLKSSFGVCRMKPDSEVPAWAFKGEFCTVSKTVDELSVVCESSRIPEGVQVEHGWKAMKVEGPLDFSLVGILADLSGRLAESEVSIFAISTFDTDYLLVKECDLERAMRALSSVGHTIKA